MAVTGLILIGFIVAHLLGNFLVFLGPDWMNSYAHHLRELGPLLWLVRIILLVSVGLHIWAAVQLTIENRKARPQNYHLKKSIQTTYAARTMALSGIIVLAFIIYHLLHFTFRITNPEFSNLHDALGRPDVYSMVVLSFKNVYISSAYIFSMFLLCSHLSHGFASMFQSLGVNKEESIPTFKWAAKIFALIIFFGYSSIPLSILLGLVRTGVKV